MSSSTSTSNDKHEEEDKLITVTVVDVTTQASESFRVAPTTTTVSDWMEFVGALLPSLQPSDDHPTIQLVKDGVVLYTTSSTTTTANTANTTTATTGATSKTTTLAEIGIVDQDIIAGRRVKRSAATAAAAAAGPSSSLAATTTTTTTGLDFTNLLSSHSSPTIPAPPPPAATYVYHGPTMNLQEAQYYNPHPTNMVTLLFEKPHLLKELNYYAPSLAEQLISLQPQQQQPPQPSNSTNGDDEWLARASDIYRHYMIQQSITTAVQKTTRYHLERDMQQRHLANPDDPQAAEYRQQQQRQRLIQEQYEHVMNEYPESIVGRVLMLYISVKINGFPVAAFCDSGAQHTIMSLSLARQCQLESLIDTRMAGVAVGVGTGVILGRIHMVQMEIQSPVTHQTYYFPCSITVMDDPPPQQQKAKAALVNGEAVDDDDDDNHETVGGKEMPFLLGLDMLKRHLCCIDLSQACLRFTQIRLDGTTDPPQYLEVPFLHEKDLLPSQGGTMKPPE